MPIDLKVSILLSNCLECCMNRTSQEKILLTKRVKKWPCQPINKDFTVAEWVDQGEQLIISMLSSQGAREQWKELITLCKEKHYPKPS